MRTILLAGQCFVLACMVPSETEGSVETFRFWPLAAFLGVTLPVFGFLVPFPAGLGSGLQAEARPRTRGVLDLCLCLRLWRVV